MGLFKDDFTVLKKASEPLYKTPKSIQETIEILKIAENGIMEVAKGMFAKSYYLSDINYTTTSDMEQEAIALLFCKTLNSLDCRFKFTVNNKEKDMEELHDMVLLSYLGDDYDFLRKAYNDVIEEKIVEGKQGIEQELYLTITIERKTFEEAKAQFATIEATLQKRFAELGSEIRALNGNERLNILYDYYHMGDGTRFQFDLKEYKKLGKDYKNDLCNGVVKFYPDYFEDERKFCRALFIKRYPNSLSDRFLVELASLPIHCMISMDGVPVAKDVTTKVLQKKYLGIEADILKQQQVRNRNNDFASEISYMKKTEKKEIEAIMDDVKENDQCLFYVSVTILLMADTKEELDSITETVQAIGKGHNCVIDTLYLKQREALNTALPIGVRQVETMRTMLTNSLVALMPFNVQELNHKRGQYYGINQISRNINVADRKKLLNGNAFVFGVPGAGKSLFGKMEMGMVRLSTDDYIAVVDPMNEYIDVAKKYGGTVINMSSHTENYVNPLEVDVYSLDLNDSNGVIAEKSQFMMALCEQCCGKAITPQQYSIIDRCVRDMYFDIVKSEEKHVPIMSDFYERLKADTNKEAQELALALEIFVEGSLNIFNHHTNVDMDNRFMVYSIRDLGERLSPICMLVMMESIQQKIIENGMEGFATWLYIDEFHVLLNSQYTAEYLQQLWKKVRKQGGLCTGITQNVSNLLSSEIATTMLSNSEFVVVMKQSNMDSAKMAEALKVSEEQLRYVKNAPAGTGLIKCGSVVIPFDNQIGKDTELYKIYSTNIHEKIAEQKKAAIAENP